MTEISESDLTGRRGKAFIEQISLSMGSIFRETSHTDIGIDGTLELFDNGRPMDLLHVQSKAGSSYFRHEDAVAFSFVIDAAHLRYWSRQKLPVLVVVSRPVGETGWEGWWVNIGEYLEEMPEILGVDNPTIHISKSQKFDSTFKTQYRPAPDGYYGANQFEALYKELLDLKHREGAFVCDGLTLYRVGLLPNGDFCFHPGFFMDLMGATVGGASMGSNTHAFLTRYVMAILRHGITLLPKADVEEVIYEREMHPAFISKMTRRGRGFRSYIQSNHAGCTDQTASERSVQVIVVESLLIEWRDFPQRKDGEGYILI